MAQSPVPGAEWNRGSVPDPGSAIPDTVSITSSIDIGPCGIHRPLLEFPPGSRLDRLDRTNSVQVTLTRLMHESNRCHSKVTSPLPDFGTDRMGDFERVGTANLWKSGPLFSTGAENAEPATGGASIEPVLAST